MRILDIAKTVFYLAAATLCVAVTVFAVRADRAIEGQARSVGATITKTNQALDDAHRVLLEAGLTAMEARKASAKESKYLDQWNVQLSVTLASANATLVSMAETSDGIRASQALIATQTVATLKSAQESIDGIKPVEIDLGAAAVELRQTTADLDSVIADPNLRETMGNLQVTSKAVAGMATDTEQYWHGVLHPSWPRKIWTFVSGVGVNVATHLW